MKYYLLEEHEPTNCPGDVITRKIFVDKDEAKKAFEELLEDYEFDPDTDCRGKGKFSEWDDEGTNWKRLEWASMQSELFIVLDEIDNDKKEK